MFIWKQTVVNRVLSFYIDHSIRSHVLIFTYGIPCRIHYNNNDDEHLHRFASSVISLEGDRQIPGDFDVILPKVGHLPVLSLTWIVVIQYMQNTHTSETKEFGTMYFQEIVSPSGLSWGTVSLDCYRRELANPRWKDIDAGMSLLTLLAIFIFFFAFVGMYSMLCTIEIDLSKLGHSLGRHPLNLKFRHR